MTDGRYTVSPLVRRYLVGVGFSSLGIGLTLPFLMVYLHDVRGISTLTVGLVLAWMALVTLVMAGPTGVLVDRYGPGPILVVSLVITAISVTGYGMVEKTWQAFAVGTAAAIGNSGLHGPGNAMVASLVPVEHRQHVYGLQFALLNLGIGLGGLMSAAIVDTDTASTFELLYLVSGLAFGARVVVQLTLRKVGGPVTLPASSDPAGPAGAGPSPQVERQAGYREVFADRAFVRLLLLGLVAITCGYAQFEAGFTAFATQQADISPRTLALTFAANTAVIVAAQMLVVKRLHGRSRTAAVALATLAWGVSWLLTGAAGLDPGTSLAVSLLVLSTVVFALGETIWAPIIPALVNDMAPAEIRGRYNAAHSVTWSVALIIGPVIAGGLIGAGLAAAWIGLISAGCLVAALLAVRLRAQLTPEQDGRIGTSPEDSRADVGVAEPAVGR